MLRYGSQFIGRSIAAAQFARHGGDAPTLSSVPRTSFNEEIGPHRALSFASVSFDDVRALSKHQDVKVNDVVLTLCSGAIRRYLANRDELPTQPLVSGVPVSTRAEGDTAMDNQIATMHVSLASHIEDPLERLGAIHRSSQSAKEMTDAVRARHIQSIGETAPPLLLNFAIRTAASTHLMNRLPTATNLLVSNVPGPPVPLYAAGAKVLGIYSTSVILEGMGLNITLFSYEDRMDFGLLMDPDLVDDPWELAEGIPMALEELMAAAGLGEPSDVDHPFGDEVMPHSAARAAELAAAAKRKTPNATAAATKRSGGAKRPAAKRAAKRSKKKAKKKAVTS
jgi:WS/DGAT/MGAT family acyltransferase